jgi:hypothetical protein
MQFTRLRITIILFMVNNITLVVVLLAMLLFYRFILNVRSVRGAEVKTLNLIKRHSSSFSAVSRHISLVTTFVAGVVLEESVTLFLGTAIGNSSLLS